MAETNYLLPCPFCGNDTAIRILDENDLCGCDCVTSKPHYAVVCCVNELSLVPMAGWKPGCGASGGFAPTGEEAAKKWNRRVDTDGK